MRQAFHPIHERLYLKKDDPVSRIAISGGDGDTSIQLYRQCDAWPTSTAVEDMGVEGWDLNIASVKDAFEKWLPLPKQYQKILHEYYLLVCLLLRAY